METPEVPKSAASPAAQAAPEIRRSRIGTIVGAAVLVLVAGGVIVWIFAVSSESGDPVLLYPRAAVIEVTRPESSLSSDPAINSHVLDPIWQREILSHAAAIKHRENIERALKSPNVQGTAWYRQFSSPEFASLSLTRSLRVRAVPGTALIEVFVATSASGQEQAVLAQAVVDTYLEQQRQRRTLVLLDRTQMLNTVRIRLESRSRDLEQEVLERIRNIESYRARTTNAATTRPGDVALAERQELAVEEEKLARGRDELQHLRLQLYKVKQEIEEVMSNRSSQSPGGVIIRNLASNR
jgi:hypothetical protein